MHTATGFRLTLNSVRILMFPVLAYLPWINTHNFFAFRFHRLHQSQNSYFHIIKMTLAELKERERVSSFPAVIFFGGVGRRVFVVHELCMEMSV